MNLTIYTPPQRAGSPPENSVKYQCTESANSIAAGVVRRISKCQDGEMVLRHIAAGFIETERGFMRIKGFKQIPIFVSALIEEVGYFSDDMNRIDAA